MAEVDWNAWRHCQVCGAERGQPCVSRSGKVVDGRPDNARTELARPHLARKERTGPGRGDR